MKTPGITVRPLINMADRHDFNEVFFEDVRVPARNLVGEENRGWYVGMTLLDFERSGIGAHRQRSGARWRSSAAVAEGTRRPAARAQRGSGCAELVIENDVARCLGYRIGDMQARGQLPNYEASMVKSSSRS